MNSFGSDAFVFFGATGDLAYKKIFPALHALIKRGNLDIPIIGVAREGWTAEQLRMRAHDSLEHFGGVEADTFAKLSSLLQYIDGDYEEPSTYDRLKQALNGAARPLHYLAVPPSMFTTVVRGLGQAGCAYDARIVLGKPLGRGLASAHALIQV